MSDEKITPVAQCNLAQLTQEEAVDLVVQCEQAPVEELWKKLSMYITQLRTASCCCALDVIESFTHVVYKGFYRKCEEANALRYFYWGYFVREQEDVVRAVSKDNKLKAIDLIASAKHFPEIMHYLYTNGCSQQREIVKSLGVDKSNLSRLLKVLVNCGLITKLSGPKHVFYELTHDGYSYYRERNLARHFSAEVSKKVVKLQSGAVQIRDELLHLDTAHLPCNVVPRPLHTIKLHINLDSRLEEDTFIESIPVQHMGFQYTDEEKDSQYMVKILPKDSKYSAWSYPIAKEW